MRSLLRTAGPSLRSYPHAGGRRRGSSLTPAQLSRTLAPAFWRSQSLRRPEVHPLCVDRQAALLVDALLPEAERQSFEALEVETEAEIASTHEAFVDRLVLDSASRRVKQFVFVGSGMDTRSYRLALQPQIKVIEVDEAEVHSVKEEVLSAAGERPRCSVRRLPAPESFLSDAKLPEEALAAALKPHQPSVFVLGDLLCVWPSRGHIDALSTLWRLAGSGSSLVAQIRARPNAEMGVPEAVSAAQVALESSGWERVDVVGHKALSRLFHGRAPPESSAVLIVAERGVPQTPGRPSAPGAHREDGAPMSTYGSRD